MKPEWLWLGVAVLALYLSPGIAALYHWMCTQRDVYRAVAKASRQASKRTRR